jgi:Recombinase
MLSELATLVEAAAEMKWALARLRVEHGQTTRRGIVVTATFERRLEAAIGAAIRASVPRRRAAGVRFGRQPLIPDTVLAQIVRDKDAGTSYRRIAQELQAAGVPTAQGGREWRASTVRAAYLRASQAGHD